MNRRPLVIPLLVLAGCQTTPADPFVQALEVVQRGRFMEALDLLDGVPPANPGYTEARTLAQALERRIRTSHEKVLEGLTLRTEWRDEEAIAKFEQALDIWSDVAGAHGLIRATRRRMVVLGVEGNDRRTTSQVAKAPEIPSVSTKPVLSGGDSAVAAIGATPQAALPVSPEPVLVAAGPAATPSKPGGEVAPPTPGPQPPTSGSAGPVAPGSTSEPAQPAAGDPGVPPAGAESRQPRAQMSEVTRLLGEGRMDQAMDLLEALWREHPADPNLARVFSRVLHQRALLAYGQGRLQAAIDDWDRVLRLEQAHEQAAEFMKAAKTELAARKATRAAR